MLIQIFKNLTKMILKIISKKIVIVLVKVIKSKYSQLKESYINQKTNLFYKKIKFH